VLRICPACHATYRGDEKYCIRDAAELQAATEEEADLAFVGTTIGNYRLTDIVGRGGMGTVFAAEHVYLGKRVAMKILHERWAKRGDAVGRFLREARAASSINHTNIVNVFDFGPAPDGRVYLAMELLEGLDLDDQLDRLGSLPLHRSINIVNQVASALASAHDKGIVHSDLKPANVRLIERPGRREMIRSQGLAADGQPRFVVEPEGAFDFVKVLDFGIARVHSADDPPEGVPHLFGTPEYMAPEAARGEEVDARSDIYALGVLFFEMLTGDVPFHAASPVGVLHKHLSEPPPRPSLVAPEAEITPAAERLILAAMEKDPANRPQTMDDVRAELSGCYGTVAYRRDADRVAGAAAQGLRPRRRRLTDELDEWLAREKEKIERRVHGEADPPEDDAAEELAGEPLLLTQRKPI
jgi:eukaryotic-like serine/threonine-protein kinase